MLSKFLLHRGIIIRTVLLTLVAFGALLGAEVNAQDEPNAAANKIFELAKAVHQQNIEFGGYTYWVKGDMGDPGNAQRPAGLIPGKEIPPFTFTEFDGRSKFTEKDLKPPYIVNFWASWCVPCRMEFPMLSESIENGSINIPVYFVNTGELSKADARLFLLTYAGNITVLSDVRSKFGNRVGLNFIPVTILVDANSNIQALHPGGLTELTLEFLVAIARDPELGGFDRSNPDKMPAPMK